MRAKTEKMVQISDSSGGQVPAQRTGGAIIVDCLLSHGVDTVFCLPGESFLAVLDAFGDVRDKIRVVVGRHEASVGNMAEAYGKLTGKPGICFVTRGPGLSQAAVALHTAFQDSTPLVMFVGQISREHLGREAFQEIDYRRFFGDGVKWVAEIVDPHRAPEIINRAFHVAINGRPGPVVISIPEDMQDEFCSCIIPAHYKLAAAAPSAQSLSALQAAHEKAERPLLILGGGGWTEEAVSNIRTFSEKFKIPVATGFRRQDLFNNTHPHYAGNLGLGTNPKLVEMVRHADLLLVVGERLSEMTTDGYTLIDTPKPKQRMIHVHPGAEELGVLYEADLLINASVSEFSYAAANMPPVKGPDRTAWIEDGHASYETFSCPPKTSRTKINVPKLIRELSDKLPPNAAITNGAGYYTANVHRFYQFRDYGSQVAPTSGAMGYGLPAAIAAKVVHPDRPAVCFAGDGCFLMASPEMATAVMFNLPVIVIVIDNASYGSIRGHQERHFPGRVMATDLVNPDFVALAHAYGAYGEEIARTEDFGAAFDRAVASGRPAILTFKQEILEALGVARA